MEPAPQNEADNDSNNARAVTRTQSNEEAPFSVDDLQSELSSIPTLSETHQSSATPASQPATNASGLDAESLGPFTHDSSQALWTSDAAAAAERSESASGPANSTEAAEGHNAVVDSPPTQQAEQQTLQSPSTDENAGTPTGYSHAPLQAANNPPEALTIWQTPAAQNQHTPAEEHPASSTEAGPGSTEQEDAAAPRSSNAGNPLSTSSGHPIEDHAAAQAWLDNASQSQSQLPAADADALAASSVPQSAVPRGANSQQLHLHVSEEQRGSSWASHAFPENMTDVEAAATTGSTEASTEGNIDADLAGSFVQAQGQLQGGGRADAAAGHETSTKDTPHKFSAVAGGHTSTYQSEPPLETQANDSSWADGESAEAAAFTNKDTPSDGGFTEVSASGNLNLPIDSSISQNSSRVPQEPQADDSHWADDAFAAATAASAAEQTASSAFYAESQAAVDGLGDTVDSVAQTTAASSEAPSGELSASDTGVPSSLAADTAATGEANTAADTNVAEQPGKQQADEGEWGDDDDFGDFNDAGDDGDDGGFGAFNEAEPVTPRSADSSVQSPQSRVQAPQVPSTPPGMCKQDCCKPYICPPTPPHPTPPHPTPPRWRASFTHTVTLCENTQKHGMFMHSMHPLTSYLKLLQRPTLAQALPNLILACHLLTGIAMPASKTQPPCSVCVQL